MAGQTSLSLTEARERLLKRLRGLTGENTNAKAIDQAARHALETERDLEDLADELEQEFQAEADRYALGDVKIEVSVDAEF